MIKNTKTKWYPLLRYSHCAAYEEFLVMARADKKTGLFEFKTISICKHFNIGDFEMFQNFNVDFGNTFNKLIEEVNNEHT